MMLTKRHIIFAVFVAILPLPSIADAAPRALESASKPVLNQYFASGFVQNLPRVAQAKISASKAKTIALRKVGGGEVVDIERKGNSYRVRVIRKDGRVIDVYVDANSGRVKN